MGQYVAHPSILLVQSEPLGSEMVRTLQFNGFPVQPVQTVFEARRLLSRESFSVLMVEYNPIRAGKFDRNKDNEIREFLNVVRNNEESDSARVILMPAEHGLFKIFTPKYYEFMQKYSIDGLFYPYTYHREQPSDYIPPWVLKFVMLGPLGRQEQELRKLFKVVKDEKEYLGRRAFVERQQNRGPERW